MFSYFRVFLICLLFLNKTRGFSSDVYVNMVKSNFAKLNVSSQSYILDFIKMSYLYYIVIYKFYLYVLGKSFQLFLYISYL
jgi:hypothetical protein